MNASIHAPRDVAGGRAPLAAAIACVFALAGAARPAGAGDDSWLRFRADPARRIFAHLPAPRSLPPVATAVVRAVTDCADDGPGSLRAAVTGAGNGDTIDLTALTCATITLSTGAIAVPVDDLTVVGPGREALAIDGGNADRVLIHPYGGALSLRGLTIQHGRDRATGFHVAGGGCIASAGYLTLKDATVRACYAGGEGAYGGAIYAYALTLAGSTLSSNVASGVHEDAGTAAFGGAAFVYSMQLIDSTVSGNRAEHHVHEGRTSYDIGGGIISVHGGSIVTSTIDSNLSQGRAGGIATFGDVSVSNSTFSGNIAETEIGGGLFLRWPATMQVGNSTFSANHAEGGGGGIWLAVAAASLQSSIVSGNNAGAGRAADLMDAAALTVSGADNLVGTSSETITLPDDTLAENPRLAPLAPNGGPTRTHALRAGSPALDAGNNLANLASDQRGTDYPRVHGASADIGAFEQQVAPPPDAVQTPVPALSAWLEGLLAAAFALLGAARVRTRQNSRRAPNCS
jgi:hypothetical protein